MKSFSYSLALLFCLLLFACNSQSEKNNSNEPTNNANAEDTLNKNQTPGLGYDFKNNGKNRDAPLFSTHYQDTLLQNISIAHSETLAKALKGSERYLKRKKRNHSLSEDFTISDLQIKKTIQAIYKWQKEGGELSDYVNTYQLEGEDQRGNIHFTGYYIPVLQVSKKPTEQFKYPLYAKPKNWKGKLPNRQSIDTDGVLKGKGLEIAYSDNLLANYTMQVQGSGVVEYPDGKRSLLTYGGKNGHDYKSLGKYLVSQGYVPADKISLDAIRNFMAANPDSLAPLLNYNPSYVFFKEVNAEPSGAAGVTLVAQHSVAVYKKEIPLGSILLGKVPVLNDKGELTGHEFRILTAHDVGGAINKGHVDFYSGIGQKGEDIANALHHYGQVWMLKAK